MKMEVDEENPNRSKRQRSTTSNGGKGQGKGKGRKGQAKMQNIKDESTQDSKTILQTLSKLVLRHEDSLQCLAMETDFYVFLSAGPGSILKLMMSKTSEWHQAPQEERPLPLRILILKSTLEELNRTLKLQSTDSSDPLIQTLVRLKFLQLGDDQKEPYIFPRMKWDHAKNEIQALPDAQISLSLALHTLHRMLTLLQSEALIKRFHALRPNHQTQKVLGTDSENPAVVIPFLLERIERALAPTGQHGTLATHSGQDETSHDAEDPTCSAPGSHARDTMSTSEARPPLKTLLNPSSACYMNAAVTGLVWGASQVNGLSEDQWSNFPGVFSQIAEPYDGESILLWANGQWTSLLVDWPDPFRQRDVVDFSHHILQLLNPMFFSCCWESRLEQDGIVKVVDQNDHSCPLHLYVSSQSGSKKQAGSADLQALLTSWSMASFGLHALVSPADLTCIQLDRFDSYGQKCRARVHWSSKVGIPHYIGASLELDNILYEVCALAYHLGQDSQSGHYVSALLQDGTWWAYNDSDDPQPFKVLPPVILENVCMLWLKCAPHGGAEIVSLPAEEAPSLSRDEQIQNVTTDPTPRDPWFHEWLQALDRLDTQILIDNPELCDRLVKKCLLCQTWPANMNAHLATHHQELWSMAETLEETCAERFQAGALATRWCACQPYQRLTADERDNPSCTCLRQFACLHLQLRSTQRHRAQTTTLALLIGTRFG